MSRTSTRVAHDLSIAAQIAANSPVWPSHSDELTLFDDGVPHAITCDADTMPIVPELADGSIVIALPAVPRTATRRRAERHERKTIRVAAIPAADFIQDRANAPSVCGAVDSEGRWLDEETL